MPPTAPTASAACGRCGRPVPVTAWTTWCQACDWNVVTSPEPPPTRSLERWQRRIAQRVGARRYAELVAGRRAGLLERASGALLLLLAMIVHLTTLTLLMLLVWAVLAASGLWRWTALAGLVAVTCLAFPRPRPLNGAVVVLTRDQAPGLWGLVDQTAAAMGSRPPALLGVDRNLNAYATRSGWRWRSTVIFGLPLWSALQPQERVAVLAHEFGHLGHGDVRRLVVVTLAMDCVQGIFDVLSPDDVDEDPVDEDIAVLALVALPLRRMLALPLLGILLLMAQLSAWSGQREEYLADLAGAGVAGTGAARAALLRTLGLPGLHARMQSAVRRREDIWQTLDAAPTPDARELRRLLRESELIGHQIDAGHPPTHLRVQLVSAAPAASAAVVLDQGRQLLIERELAPARERLTGRLTDDLLE